MYVLYFEEFICFWCGFSVSGSVGDCYVGCFCVCGLFWWLVSRGGICCWSELMVGVGLKCEFWRFYLGMEKRKEINF